MQCCELQRHKRLKLFEVKARLIAIHENPGTCAYYFPCLRVILSDTWIGYMISITIYRPVKYHSTSTKDLDIDGLSPVADLGKGAAPRPPYFR